MSETGVGSGRPLSIHMARGSRERSRSPARAAPNFSWWQIAIVAGAIGAAFAPLPRISVERAYSTAMYPMVQRLLTALSNRVPFALFDVLIIVATSAWLLGLVADIARRRQSGVRVGTRLVVRTATMTATFYLAFLCLWGLNYRRVKLVDKLQFDAALVTPDTAHAAALVTVSQLNALHGPAHAAGWAPADQIDLDLAAAFARVDSALGSRTSIVPGRPKATWLDGYFRRVGVEGMTDPFFLEILVQQDLLPFERPFVVAHEWSHLAGFADESEANFVGWLTCLRGSPGDQYSAWLFLYGELVRAVRPGDRDAIVAQLSPGPRADLQAIAARVLGRINVRLSTAGWRAYDGYLKANRVDAGTRSYNQVVQLVLGVRFGAGWTPLLRPADDVPPRPASRPQA